MEAHDIFYNTLALGADRVHQHTFFILLRLSSSLLTMSFINLSNFNLSFMILSEAFISIRLSLEYHCGMEGSDHVNFLNL